MKKLISISASLLLAGASLVGVSAPAQATTNFLGKYFVASQGLSTESIHEIDPTTGEVKAPIATIPMTNSSEYITGLEVDGSTGIAYFSTPHEFWSVNLNTGTANRMVASTVGFDELAMDPTTGALFGYVFTSEAVYSIDKATGVSTLIGSRPVSRQQNLVGGNGFAVSTNGLFYFSGPSASAKLEIADRALSAGMTIGVVAGLSNSRGTAIFATDVTQSGDLVEFSPAAGPTTPARLQTASAASIDALDQVGAVGVSSSRNVVVPTLAVTVQLGTYSNIDPWSFAIANGVAPAPTPVTTPVVVQAPVYTGPEFNAIAGRVIDSVEGGKVVLTGRRLDSVTKISLAGKVLTPTKSTESSIELTVPAGTPGSATLEITFTSGRMTWTNAFDYVDPAVVKAQAANKLPKPAAKPATKPAAKPATKPAAKPATKPAAKVTKAKPKAKK
jgi:hypothetical protein